MAINFGAFSGFTRDSSVKAMAPMLRSGLAGAGIGVGAQFGYNAVTGNQGGYKRSAALGFLGGAGYRGYKMGGKAFGDTIKSFGRNVQTRFSSLNG